MRFASLPNFPTSHPLSSVLTQSIEMSRRLATEEGRKITGQIFGVRGNEVVLFDQPRPVKSVARLEGWNPETLLDQCMPAMQADFTDLGATASVFPYDPI